MQVKAKSKYLRMSSRKARLVVNEVRGLDLTEALNKLTIIEKKAVKYVTDLLNSAAANAKENNQLEFENLFVADIRVDEGPTFYRWFPRAQGRATPKRKKTCHISVLLEEKKPTKKVAPKEKTEIETTKIDATELENLSSTKSGKGDLIDERDTGRKGKDDKGMINKMFRRKSGM
jgi:large subunit ribosomal protein L22